MDSGLAQTLLTATTLMKPDGLSPSASLPVNSAWFGHIPFAFWVVENLCPRTFVELGTAHGTSLCAFNQAITHCGLATRSYAIDTWQGDEHAGFYNEAVYQGLSTYHDAVYGEFSRLIRSTFDEAATYFSDRTVDLLHIDGFHSYEAVRHDFEVWLPKLSDKAVVLFHDINVRERGFGVWKFWEEVSQRYRSFSFLHWHGLGVLGVGEAIPENIRKLFDADQDPAAIKQIRQHFSALGENAFKHLQAKESSLRAALPQESVSLTDVLTHIHQLSEQVSACNAQIEALSNEIIRLEEAAKLDLTQPFLEKAFSRSVNHLKSIPLVRTSYRNLRSTCQALYSRIRHSLGQIYQICKKKLGNEIPQGEVGVLEDVAAEADLLPETSLLTVPKKSSSRNEDQEETPQYSKDDAGNLSQLPLFSFLPLVEVLDARCLRQTVHSLQKQIYQGWEFCCPEYFLKSQGVYGLLQSFAKLDSRIKIIDCDISDVSVDNTAAALNKVLETACGEYVIWLSFDGELSPKALSETAAFIQTHPTADFIYSDEDVFSSEHGYHHPFFKPDWSPERLQGQMYTRQLSAYRIRLVRQMGGLRDDFTGAQLWDLTLRLTETTSEIFHIQKILYHRDATCPMSPELDYAQSQTQANAQKALEDAINRSNYPGWVEPCSVAGLFRVRRHIVQTPLISIIIPTCGAVIEIEGQTTCLLENCIQRLLQSTTYPKYEFVIVDGYDLTDQVLAFIETIPNTRLVRCDRPFNFSERVNLGAAAAQGDVLVFLNDDTEIMTPDWLESMLELAQQDPIGAVGAKLLFPDRRIQHAGIHILAENAARACLTHYGLEENYSGYFSSTLVNINLLAVIGACLMIRRNVFEQVGGFDETLAISLNDVDFCLKIHQHGYRNVFTPFAKLIHYETASRPGKELPLGDVELFWHKWSGYIKSLGGDPYYNPNFLQTAPNYQPI